MFSRAKMESLGGTKMPTVEDHNQIQTTDLVPFQGNPNSNFNEVDLIDQHENGGNNNQLIPLPSPTTGNLQEEVEESISTVSTKTVERRVLFRRKKEGSELKRCDPSNVTIIQEHDQEDKNERAERYSPEMRAEDQSERGQNMMEQGIFLECPSHRYRHFLIAGFGFLLLCLIIIGGTMLKFSSDDSPCTAAPAPNLECDKILTDFSNFKNTLTYFKNNEWDFVLHSAIDAGDEPAVKILALDLGADLNRKNNKSETPLHRAAMLDDKAIGLRIIHDLVDNWADIYAKDRKGFTFLHKLVDDETTLTLPQFHEVSTYLISRNVSKLFNTPGTFAKGIRLPPRASAHFLYTFTTPLQLAVKNLDVDVQTLMLLRDHGVNFTVEDSLGRSLLNYAIAGRRSPKLLSDLITLGGDWRHLDKLNSTLLHEAALYGNLEGIKFMLSLGMDINIPTVGENGGNSPLHWVALYGKDNSLETIRFLIDHGADAKLTNGAGETPLDKAVKRYDKVDKDKIVQLLRNSQ